VGFAAAARLSPAGNNYWENSRSAVIFSRISAGSRFVTFAENILQFVMFAARCFRFVTSAD
jgi:hypothetical protein